MESRQHVTYKWATAVDHTEMVGVEHRGLLAVLTYVHILRDKRPITDKLTPPPSSPPGPGHGMEYPDPSKWSKVPTPKPCLHMLPKHPTHMQWRLLHGNVTTTSLQKEERAGTS